MRARKPCCRYVKVEKTNEIPIAKAVLPCLPNTPRVYTADALHTHADFMQVVHAQHGFSLLTVKGNQPILKASLRLYFTDPATSFLPNAQARTVDRRRGRDSGTLHPGHHRASMTRLSSPLAAGATSRPTHAHRHGAAHWQDHGGGRLSPHGFASRPGQSQPAAGVEPWTLGD